MRYALLVYPGRTLTELPAADRQSVLDESEALVQAPGVVGGAAAAAGERHHRPGGGREDADGRACSRWSGR
jgi:hypothetical protein